MAGVTIPDSDLASRGRYVVLEPRYLRVLRLLFILSLPASIVALAAAIWLRWLPLESWQESTSDLLFIPVWVLGYALLWKYDLSMRAAVVEWDENGLALHTVGWRSVAITWQAVKEVRIPVAFAGTYETAGNMRVAHLFVVGKRLPYLIPMRWGDTCAGLVGAFRDRGRVVDV